MVGQDYFRGRLGDIYELSPIPYLSGTGTLFREGTGHDAEWELNADITGNHVLVLTLHDYLNFDSLAQPGGAFVECTFRGTTTDGEWAVHSSAVIVPGMSIVETGQVLYCQFRQMRLEKHGAAKCPTEIQAQIMNFSFSPGRFRIQVQGREVVFALSPSESTIRRLLESKRIDRAVLSTVSIPINGDLSEARHVLGHIGQMLSISNLNANFSPIYLELAEGCVVATEILGCVTSPYHRNVVIDNLYVRNGLCSFIEATYDTYVRLDNSWDLRKLVSNLLGMYEGKFLENKIAGLILSLEYLLTKYLQAQGVLGLADLNIQQKIRQTNSTLRFIPAALQGDDLRSGVRNPLFHQGEIVIADHNDLIRTYAEYSNLLFRILFRILGYGGQFISRVNYEPTSV